MPETTGQRGRKPLFPPETTIDVLTTEHAMKPKSTELFNKLVELPAPITVQASRAAGVPSGYLPYFEGKGLIRVNRPAEAQPEAAAAE